MPAHPSSIRRARPSRIPGLAAAVLLILGCGPATSPEPGPPGMVWIAGGEFTMGSDARPARADEAPAHRVRVDGFWMDESEVTNAQFRAFVDATGYVTDAERAPDLEALMAQVPPGTPPPPPEMLVPGSLVFTPPAGPGQPWWKWQPAADWRQPEGPGSDLAARSHTPG